METASANTTFRAACATGKDWEDIARQCIEQLSPLPSGNFGWIYVTEPLAPRLDLLLQELIAKTGIAHWTGTVGSGICFTGREIYDEPAAAIMLACLPENSFRIVPSGINALSEMLEEQRPWLQAANAHFGILHGDPRNSHVPQVIASLSAELDPGFFVGGLSSADNDNMLIQVADSLTEDGVSGAIFSADIPVISSHTQGCTPIGPTHKITRCERNILITLDDKPALDVFRNDIGEVLAQDLSRTAGYIFAGLPIQGSDTGDYLVRNLVGMDPDEKLLAVGDMVDEEASVMFCKRDSDTAREDMLRMLNDLKKRATGKILGGLYYSCLGRGRHQFGDNSEELKMITDILGDFPLVGFFANGEISHNRLYGYTGVLTLFLAAAS